MVNHKLSKGVDNLLNWHQTTSPTQYMRAESNLEESTAAPYDPAQLFLDYLPFTWDNKINKPKIDSCTNDSSSISCDSDDKEHLVVYYWLIKCKYLYIYSFTRYHFSNIV